MRHLYVECYFLLLNYGYEECHLPLVSLFRVYTVLYNFFLMYHTIYLYLARLIEFLPEFEERESSLCGRIHGTHGLF